MALALKQNPLAPLLVVAGFVIGGLLVMPVTLLISATLLAFGPVLGLVYSLLGSLASAVVVFAIGHRLGRSTVHRLLGERAARVSQQLARRGLLAVVVVRMLPVAPFTVVNFVAAVSHIRFRDYVLGTALGMLPGMFALTLFLDRIWAALRKPGMATAAALLIALTVIFTLLLILRRWLAKSPRRNVPR
jgi:uncharacterized membrane protein YdjX (TVP38/TMEM64 family)